MTLTPALRDATSLVNAPRRTGAADATPALRLLLAADGPKVVTKGDSDDARADRRQGRGARGG